MQILTITNVSVDVIGLLNSKHSKYEYTSENNEKKFQVKFNLTDGRYESLSSKFLNLCFLYQFSNFFFVLCFSCLRNVTLFDKFAEYVDSVLNAQIDESVVVILASAKVNKYEGNNIQYCITICLRSEYLL